jgi:hypothetical protein
MSDEAKQYVYGFVCWPDHTTGWSRGDQCVGDELRECPECRGMGDVFIRPDGTTFLYPGGPIIGKRPASDYANAAPVDRLTGSAQ